VYTYLLLQIYGYATEIEDVKDDLD